MSATVALDCSALVKLVLEERDSSAFFAWYAEMVRSGAKLIGPQALFAETGRVLQREHDLKVAPTLHRELLSQMQLLPPANPWSHANWLEFFDALYLDAARDADMLCTYDEQMIAAATEAGIATVSPGMDGGHPEPAADNS